MHPGLHGHIRPEQTRQFHIQRIVSIYIEVAYAVRSNPTSALLKQYPAIFCTPPTTRCAGG
jgi:hypothetical protein